MKPISVNRLSFPDFIKGVAVLCMIQVHLAELFATADIYNGFSGKIFLFLGSVPAAPVFMAVMGYFAIQARQTGKAIFRGLKIIALGLLLNIGLNAHLLWDIYGKAYNLNPWHYVFGADILFLAGISLIVIALLKMLFSEKIILWLLFALVVASANVFLPDYSGRFAWIYYLQALFWGHIEWSYFPVFPWLFYPVLGIIFFLIEKKNIPFINSAIQSKWALPLVFLLNIPFFKYGFSIAVDLTEYYHHSLLFALWAVLFMVFWFLFSYWIFKLTNDYKPNTYLIWVGKNVTAFYIFQWLLIGNIATAVYRTQAIPNLLFWFVAVTLMSSIMVKIWLIVRAKATSKKINFKD